MLLLFFHLSFDNYLFSRHCSFLAYKNDSSIEGHLKCYMQSGARDKGRKLVYLIIHRTKTIHLEVNIVNKELLPCIHTF
jgi:hypothetical protein